MRQQFAHYIDRMIGDALQHFSKPCIGLDAMQLAGAEQRIQPAASFGGFMAAGKKIILPAQFYRTETVPKLSLVFRFFPPR